MVCFVVVKQKTAYEMRISDWSSDVCSSDLERQPGDGLTIRDRLEQDAEVARHRHLLAHDPVHLADRHLCRHRIFPFQERVATVARPPPTDGDAREPAVQIGRASCRERVCQYV